MLNYTEYKCPAKLNLSLSIVGKNNNYHLLQSVFCKINLYDDLLIKKADKFKLLINNNFSIIDLNNNLLTQILSYFKKNFEIDGNLDIILNKNIPIGAGLGGGSSNACSFIKALNQIYKLALNFQQMQQISLKFGSDIAFFFHDNFCLVEGRGEVINDLKNPLQPLEILLIYPRIHLATPNIFNDYALAISQNKQKYSTPLKLEFFNNNNYLDIIKLPNDLEKFAISNANIIAEIIHQLSNFSPINAKISGSGSACFAVFADKKKLKEAYQYFNAKYNNFFVKILQSL